MESKTHAELLALQQVQILALRKHPGKVQCSVCHMTLPMIELLRAHCKGPIHKRRVLQQASRKAIDEKLSIREPDQAKKPQRESMQATQTRKRKKTTDYSGKAKRNLDNRRTFKLTGQAPKEYKPFSGRISMPTLHQQLLRYIKGGCGEGLVRQSGKAWLHDLFGPGAKVDVVDLEVLFFQIIREKQLSRFLSIRTYCTDDESLGFAINFCVLE